MMDFILRNGMKARALVAVSKRSEGLCTVAHPEDCELLMLMVDCDGHVTIREVGIACLRTFLILLLSEPSSACTFSENVRSENARQNV